MASDEVGVAIPVVSEAKVRLHDIGCKRLRKEGGGSGPYVFCTILFSSQLINGSVTTKIAIMSPLLL